MGTAARRDDLLEQIRTLPIEDRDYIEAALLREAYEAGGRTESPRSSTRSSRAAEALSDRSAEDSVARARARASVEAIRSRKP